MHVPPPPDPEQLYGIKIASVLAGFCGSVVALSFLPTMTLWRAMISVISGTFSAAYLTPLAVETLRAHFDVVTLGAENAVAFWVGLTAMRGLPPLIDGTGRTISRLFRTLKNESD